MHFDGGKYMFVVHLLCLVFGNLLRKYLMVRNMSCVNILYLPARR